MEIIKLNQKKQKKVRDLLNKNAVVPNIVRDIDQVGGRIVLVGGAVRDLLLDLPVKDLDLEVHQLSLEALESILKKYGRVSLVGKTYGVLRLHGVDIDWSVPRTESSGRKPTVEIDPFMSIEEAFRRRDLTMNALGIDVVSLELIDPFGGIEDIEKGILRTCDQNKFLEDPLRFFRVMQFIARFDMYPDKQLNDLCTHMSVKNVSVERIDDELKKMMLKSDRPSQGFRWLKDIGRLKDVFPELYALIDVRQNPKWHPEGDVFEHTMQALDAAAQLPYDSDEQKLILMYAALCHDLGKAEVTEESEHGITSHGHAEVGVGLAKKLLKRMTRNKQLVDAVATLVKYHMHPLQFVSDGAKLSAYKRLARSIMPLTLYDLALLALADRRGRNAKKGEPLPEAEDDDVGHFLEKAHQAQVLTTVEEPLLHGRDIIDSVQPGPEMGRLLKMAYELQIEEGIRDKDELKKRILSAKKNND